MINKISTVSFKNNIQKNDELTPREIRARVYEETYGDSFKNDKLALAAGGAIALGSAIAQKSINKGISWGVGVYFATLLGMETAKASKNYEKSKDFARKYGNVDVDNANGVQKVVQFLTLPKAIDFGSDERNKQYFEFQQKENEDSFKMGGIATLATVAVTSTYSGICALAKKTKHLDKAPLVALATMLASMAGFTYVQNKLAAKNESKKEIKPQMEITKEEIQVPKEEIKPEIKEEVK